VGLTNPSVGAVQQSLAAFNQRGISWTHFVMHASDFSLYASWSAGVFLQPWQPMINIVTSAERGSTKPGAPPPPPPPPPTPQLTSQPSSQPTSQPTIQPSSLPSPPATMTAPGGGAPGAPPHAFALGEPGPAIPWALVAVGLLLTLFAAVLQVTSIRLRPRARGDEAGLHN